MLTGFEALGAASAVLQVISFATDVAVACKNAYDGATTSHDDLQRYAGQMSEAVGRVHNRCEQMNNANSKFASPKLQNIAKECKDVANTLEAEVQYVASMQAQGDILKSIRKTFRASRHRKRLHALQESLSKYQQVMEIELTSHLCSQSDAIYFQQDASFGKLDTDVQFLVNQLAQGTADIKDLVKREHAATRNVVTQESARAEAAINSHTESQFLELRTTAEMRRKCETFLRSLKAPRMNQRYNDVIDSRDASFNQVFATYKDMKAMYHESPEAGEASGEPDKSGDGNDSKDDESSEKMSDLGYVGWMKDIYRSWASLNSWLQSKDKLFYIQGKPGSGKSTLVKFILNQDQTQELVHRWSPDAIIISYFFWKIGSEEQNSIKGLWCSLLYQRLKGQQSLILNTPKHLRQLSLHSEYHDWSVKDLQAAWNYLADRDARSICIFIDGLDEIRNEDGFAKLFKSIQSISKLSNVKICMSTRPEAQIMRWLQTTNAVGILLEDLTRFDMVLFVRKRFRELLINGDVSSEFFDYLRQQLVDKAQGVFLWLHLASGSIIEGIENGDSNDMLSVRLHELPGDLEKLYTDMWQRSNAKSTAYQETARRIFRCLLDDSVRRNFITIGLRKRCFLPLILQIACVEDQKTQQDLLKGNGTIAAAEILRLCDETEASIHKRCAGLLEIKTNEFSNETSTILGDNKAVVAKAIGTVAFIHRTAHDFLTDTEAGQRIIGCETMSCFHWQTQLLKGLICTLRILTSEWDLPCGAYSIILQIANFATRWGSEGLHLATEMLDVLQPLFDNHLIRNEINPWRPQLRFLTTLIIYEVFDDYVISYLTTKASPDLATTVMREGWCSEPRVKLRKRIFEKLMVLGADPHRCGVLLSCSDPEPFIRKETAFTNFLRFYLFLMQRKTTYEISALRQLIEQGFHLLLPYDTLEMAIQMAKTCQDLNAGAVFFAFSQDNGDMTLMETEDLKWKLSNLNSLFVVYEINIQFLLLYLGSKVEEHLAGSVLEFPGAQDLLKRLYNPSIKVRYFMRPSLMRYSLKQDSAPRLKFERVVSRAASLSSIDIKRLFDVDLKNQCEDSCESFDVRTQSDVLTQFVNDLETEEVDVEDMMLTLVSENLGLGTYEEAGMIPSLEFLRNPVRRNDPEWSLFPLSMRRLEVAAAAKEAIKGQE
ncbi:hypothetical protein LB503_012609 [Fusarium chuoi]|nr:hypothetical protein LB503_012609 [Fusarium chuoi]